jgi:TetR/AcrR family transcriptional regulator
MVSMSTQKKPSASEVLERVHGDEQPTRERILNAALTEFGAFGFHGARIDRIATAAEANKQLIYYYFPSGKRGLYDAVLEQTANAVAAFGAGTESPSATYEQGAAAFRSTAGATWLRIVMWEALENATLVQSEARRARYSAMAESLRSTLSGSGVEDQIDPAMLAVVLAGLMQFPMMFPQLTKLMTGAAPDTFDFQQRYDSTVLSILRAIKED